MPDEKWLSQMKRGLLELCILNLLKQRSMYGYELVKRLTVVPDLVVTVGTIYPLLSRLKREGLLTSSLVESPVGPARRTYALTPLGVSHLAGINRSWRSIAEAVTRLCDAE